ncbi:MAG TPA: cyanate transporter [Pseudoduganella sp.]
MRSAKPTSTALLLAAIALVALNLRPFITSIGPLAVDIAAHTGLQRQGVALLTLVPMLLMGIFAFAGPALQARIGGRLAILAALAALALGSLLRMVAGSGWQVIGTAALLGLGAAIIQAVLPGIIKRQFPRHVGAAMGLYSAMLMGGGALGAQLSPLIAAASGSWQAGLAWTALPVLLALALAARCLPHDAANRLAHISVSQLLRRPRVWLLMACFGLVNGGYSTVVAWLAPFYREHGWSAVASGGLLATLALFQAAAALLLPMLAGRSEDRRPWLWLTLAMQATGFAALALWPEAAPFAWAMLLGMGLGGCFALSLITALDHLHDPAQAGALSALMQGGGFLIAALPPGIVAALRDAMGDFSAGWLLHLGCVGLVAGLYGRVAPAGYALAMRVERRAQPLETQ